MALNREFVEEWVTALRSGHYIQGSMALNKEGRYCCLGVACELMAQKGLVTKDDSYTNGKATYEMGDSISSSILPAKVAEFIGMDPWGTLLGNTRLAGRNELTTANDAGATFNEIADVLEQAIQGEVEFRPYMNYDE